MVKNMPAMQETWVQSMGQEYPLEEEMATHSRILVWKIPWTEKPCELQSMGLQSWTQLSTKVLVKKGLWLELRLRPLILR